MKSNKHILIFTPGFPKDESDGSCLPTVQNYVRELAESKKVEVTVLSLHYPFKARSYRWNGIKVLSLGGANRKYPSRFFWWNKALNTLRQIHKEKPVDVIHSFWMHECAMLGNRFAQHLKVPQVITLMGQDMKPPNRFVQFMDQQKVILAALSDFQPQLHKTGIRQPDIIIPFGLPDRERGWVKHHSKSIDVLGVGSLIKLKDYEQFIRVIDLLKKEQPEITAEIVGDGVERTNLLRLISELDLTKNVKLTGQLSRKEVYEKMSRARVFLHASDYETQGYVFNEALLANIPIVSKMVGIAEESYYWKIANDDIGMAKSLKHFIHNEVEIPDKANIRMEDTVSEYLNLYDVAVH